MDPNELLDQWRNGNHAVVIDALAAAPSPHVALIYFVHALTLDCVADSADSGLEIRRLVELLEQKGA